MYHVIALSAAALLGVAPAAMAEATPCRLAADSLARDKTMFVGLGRARSDEEAADKARADLVHQVQTRVTATTQVSETNKDVHTFSAVNSVAGESLVGAVVHNRCLVPGGWFEVVVAVPRAQVRQTLQAQYDKENTRAKSLLERLPKATPVDGFRLTRNAKELIASCAGERLELCRTLGGCQGACSVSALETYVGTHPGSLCFKETWTGSTATALRSRVASLLRDDGVCLSPGGAGRVEIDCTETVHPPVPGTNFRVARVTCHAKGTVGTEPAFALAFSRQATDSSGETALETARSTLSREKKP